MRLYFSLTLLFLAYSKPILATSVTFTTEHLPPYQFINQEHNIDGIAIDMLKAAMATLPEQAYKIKLYPWTRAYTLAQKRANTCVFSTVRTPQREANFYWIGPILQTDFTFVSLKQKQLHIENVAQAKNYRVAVIRDDISHQFLLKQGFIENQNLYLINNSYSLLKRLKQSNQIDLILTDALTIEYRAKFNQLDPKSFSYSAPINKTPLYFYIACNLDSDEQLLQNIQQAINDLKLSNEYNAILEKWREKGYHAKSF